MPNKKANPDYLAQVTKDFVVYLRAYADFLRDNNEEKKKDAFVQIQGRAQILIEQTDAGLDFLFKENASATQAAGNQKAKKVSPLQFAVTNGLTEVVQFFFSEACNAHPPALLMTNKHGPLPGQQSILMQLVDQIASLLAMPSDLKRDRQLDAVLEMLRVIKDSGALRREGTSTPQSPQKQKTKKAIDTPSELDPTIRTVYNTHIDALTKAQLPGIITRQDTAGLRALKHFVELLPGRVFSRCTDIANKDIRIDGKLVFTWIDYWAQQVNLTRDGGIACSVPDFFVLLLSSGALFGHVVQMDLIKQIASENPLLYAHAIALLYQHRRFDEVEFLVRILTGCEKEACRLVWSVLSRPLIAEDKVFLIAAMAHWPQQNWMEPILNEHLEQLLGYEPGFPKAMQALAKFFVNKEIPSTLKSYFPQLFSSETQRSAAPAAEGGSGNHSAGFWGDGAAAATAARVNAVESYDFDDSDDEARICSF